MVFVKLLILIDCLKYAYIYDFFYEKKKITNKQTARGPFATLMPELCYVVMLLFLFPRDVLQLVEQ